MFWVACFWFWGWGARCVATKIARQEGGRGAAWALPNRQDASSEPVRRVSLPAAASRPLPPAARAGAALPPARPRPPGAMLELEADAAELRRLASLALRPAVAERLVAMADDIEVRGCRESGRGRRARDWGAARGGKWPGRAGPVRDPRRAHPRSPPFPLQTSRTVLAASLAKLQAASLVAGDAGAPAAAPPRGQGLAHAHAPRAPRPPPPPPAPRPEAPASPLTSYSWMQDAASVQMYVPLRGVTTASLDARFTRSAVDVVARGVGGRDHAFRLAPTPGPIVPAACVATASRTRKNIIITLAKEAPGAEWPTLGPAGGGAAGGAGEPPALDGAGGGAAPAGD